MNSLGSPLQVFGRNVWSLMLREMRTKFGDQQLGYLWALLEPIGMIAALALIFSTGLRGRTPALGDSFILFFATGMVPYTSYKTVMSAINRAMKSNKNLLFFPVIKPIDTYIAPLILETITMMIVMLVIFLVYFSFYSTGLPDRWAVTFIPFVYCGIIGFSMSVINNSINSYFNTWQKIFKLLNRPMFFISGVFFIAESLPLAIRKILYYNPILHITEWVRTGYFKGFESRFLDLYYLNGFTIAILFIALLLERTLRRRMSSTK